MSASANKRAAHEAAIRKWLDCLGEAAQQLAKLGASRSRAGGHANMLRHQVGCSASSCGRHRT